MAITICQPAGTAADRRGRGARKDDRPRDLVIEAMEESLARAAKSRYGAEMDIRVSIDRKTGKATFTRVRTVVEDEELENYQAELTVEQAKQYLDDPKVGDQFIDEVPPVEMGRIAAQSAKQVILQKVREAERDRQYEEFKDRAGTIINGQVKREEYGNVIVDVGGAKRSCAATRRSAARAIARTTAFAATSRMSAAKPAGPADLPQPHGAGIHGRAVQDGSAGDL